VNERARRMARLIVRQGFASIFLAGAAPGARMAGLALGRIIAEVPATILQCLGPLSSLAAPE
jgi:hypothetical protein